MKDFLTVKDLNKAEILSIMSVAAEMKRVAQSKHKNGARLLGNTLGVLTSNGLTATQSAISLGYKYLGGVTVSAATKDNPIEEAQKMEVYGVNCLAVGLDSFAVVKQIADNAKCPVLNLGTKHTSPIEIITLLCGLTHYCERLNNLNIAVVGKRNQQILQELTYICDLFGSNCFPFLPDKELFDKEIDTITVLRKLDGSLSGADAIIDLGADDNLRYYGDARGLTLANVEKAKVDAPLFFRRNVVTDEGEREYDFNACDRFYLDYVSVCMAVLSMYAR